MRRSSGDIPLSVKRLLRQEAGFGCCVCGLPIIQYHHITPRAIEEHNRPEDMMVLCPNHHDAATKAAMTEFEQRRSKGTPFNITRGYVDGLLKVNQSYCVLDLGSCQMVNDGVTVLVDGDPLLTLSVVDGLLGISITLLDDQDNLLAFILDNEWVSGDPAVWDLEADHQRLVVRQKMGDIRLSLNAKTEPMRLRAQLCKGGQRIDLRPSGIWVNQIGKTPQSQDGQAFIDLCLVAMAISIDSRTETVSLVPDKRYGKGAFVSREDRLQRIAEGIQVLAGFRSERSAREAQ